MMVIIRSHRFRKLFFGAQRVHLGLDRRRAPDSRLRDLDPLFGRHHANDALDRGSSSPTTHRWASRAASFDHLVGAGERGLLGQPRLPKTPRRGQDCVSRPRR